MRKEIYARLKEQLFSFTSIWVSNFSLSAKTIISRGSNQNLRGTKNCPFTSAEVTKITNNFRTVIGKGAFGKVFFDLDDGS